MYNILLAAVVFITLGISQASAVEFDYEFRENCPHINHSNTVAAMTRSQGKLTEVIREKDTTSFYRAWAELANQQYDPEDYDVVDAIFVYKFYPSTGVFIAFRDGCFIGSRVFPLDALNAHLGRFYQIRDKGDL